MAAVCQERLNSSTYSCVQQIGLSISQLSSVYTVCRLLQGCSFYDQLDNVIENENARKSQLLVPE